MAFCLDERIDEQDQRLSISGKPTGTVEELSVDYFLGYKAEIGNQACSGTLLKTEYQPSPCEVRGEFSPIATSVPGLRICEHLPRIARVMHRACLIRTLSHGYNSHNPYGVLTGFTGGDDRENYFAKPTDHPGMGAVCHRLTGDHSVT